ncbi:PadR family transcriptional regulator [Microbacterium mangrovi]|uniref:PadR family transcriptional regulator n=1 Tax=Microbacterium mangrovi TaxID=1348253 RepID=A0A0B2A8L5_9MICO|nr:PadR family transcriptional regulator [Microbacterium mangrovi]KHK99450.1 PadR family transcriptional regulator [Microbacterium mangrovi]
MSGTNSGGFGAYGFGNGQHREGLWDALGQLRSTFEQRMSPRMSKGDVRAAVIALLAEQPMHGYQIISEIEQRSNGAWKPSAGSVYPTLQMLTDEGLLTATEANGRKTYSLTEAGRAEAAAAADKPAPWEATSAREHGALPKAGIELLQVAAQVGRTGSPEQVAEAVVALDEARRKLYGILAQG